MIVMMICLFALNVDQIESIKNFLEGLDAVS